MIFVCGFLMALADSVPGVSGGTIAFLLGFYDDFIGSLDAFVPSKESKEIKKEKRIKAIKFLVRLGIAWGVGFISAVLILTSIFQSHIYQVSSLFIGFIIFSIPLIIMEEKKVLARKYYNLIFMAAGIALVVLITALNPSETANTGDTGYNIGSLLYFMLTGMLGISAMVLPGISGSTILLIFGTYLPVMTAIKDFLHLNMQGLPLLIFFGVGVLLGIALIIRLVKKSLEKFRSQTVYAILGLMIGSLYAVVKGPESLDPPKSAMSFDTFSILFFIIGGVVILGLQAVKHFSQVKEKIEEIEAKEKI
ncbi:MAG: DUF368 domain-containing protein [Oscillospiraceae bacterium]